jgi:transposase-like protein
VASATARPDAATLAGLYHTDKMTIAGLAARFGVAPQTIHNWLVAAGVSRRPNPATARTDINDDTYIVRLYTGEGHTAAEIAHRLGCSASLVCARLARLGIPRRPPRPRRRVRPADADLARIYLKRRLSMRHIAHHYRVSPQAVWGWLVAAGIPRRPSGAAPIPWPATAPIELYQAGWSGPAIANHLGCAPATVNRHLQAAGVARRSTIPRLDRHQLLDGLARGLTAPAMAAEFGVSVSCVCRALTRERLVTAAQATNSDGHSDVPGWVRRRRPTSA